MQLKQALLLFMLLAFLFSSEDASKASSGIDYTDAFRIIASVTAYSPSNQSDNKTFPETGKTVRGKFLEYWNTHGGLTQQGFPISNEMQERSDTDGKTYTVQYFERAVFELHPENIPPHDILLSLLGNFRYNQKFSGVVPSQIANTTPGSVLFKETGKRLGGRFLEYWQTHGGLAQQGYPVSDQFQEKSELDSQTYTVQYFERVVFEYHPEYAGTRFEVLLSQLGTLRYQEKYGSQAPVAAPTPPVSISPTSLAYLQEALDFIKENSIMRDKADWVTVRREALALARNAQTTADTYPAIKYALQSLGDGHSYFLEPAEVSNQFDTDTLGISVWYADRMVTKITSGSLAEKAGVRVGDVIETINGIAPQSLGTSDFFSSLYGGIRVELELRREGEAQPILIAISHERLYPMHIPNGRRLEGGIGYIYLPGTSGSPIRDQYADIVQQIIRDIDQIPTCGWVVDLQRNGGGSIYPMIAGIGPIVGEGDLGTFIFANANVGRVIWSYRNGASLYGNEVIEQVNNSYSLKQAMPPVAVLTSRGTASAGEATLISFRGRPQTKSFGEPTAGVPTGNSGKTMSDGAIIVLTTALESDRTGRVYRFNERIQPDENVRVDLSLVGKANDPVMIKGLEWLRSQAGCSQ